MHNSEILLHVTRGSLVECLHRGHIAIADAAGRVLASAGNPEVFMFARSSMKPIQALPVLESGAAEAFGFTDAEIAILAASHNGEEFHTATVSSMLAKLGLETHCLLCGPHAPFHAPSAACLAQAGIEPTELHNNCSGKHAGMLALALHLGADTGTYMDPAHPVQQRMLETVSLLSGYPAAKIVLGTDGCGVPVFGLPLSRLAAAYARLGELSREGQPGGLPAAAKRIVSAIAAHPGQVAGTGRYDTRLIEVTQGRLIGKMGAEGVFAVSAPQLGLGLALKIEDGAQRAIYPAVTEALVQLGWLTGPEADALSGFHKPVLRNWKGTEVGEILPVLRLRQEP